MTGILVRTAVQELEKFPERWGRQQGQEENDWNSHYAL